MKYGARLKELANKAGLSAAGLGEKIGQTRQNISAVYRDKDDTDRKLPLDNHFKAAEALKICPIELYTGVPKIKPATDSNFSVEARNLATLFDMIPANFLLERTELYAEVARILVPSVQRLSSQTVRPQQDQRIPSL